MHMLSCDGIGGGCKCVSTNLFEIRVSWRRGVVIILQMVRGVVMDQCCQNPMPSCSGWGVYVRCGFRRISVESPYVYLFLPCLLRMFA